MSDKEKHDSPIFDNEAGNVDHVYADSKRDLLANDTGEDCHCCSKCSMVFTTLDAYIKHKLFQCADKCKVKYIKSGARKFVLPRIVSAKEKAKDDKAGEIPKKRKYRKSKQNRLSSAHSQEDIIDVKPEYKCNKCQRIFHREATLRRHLVFDHEQKDSDSEGEEEPNSYKDVEDGVATEDEGEEWKDTSQEGIRKPRGYYTTKDNYGTDEERPFKCMKCSKTFKEQNVLKAHLIIHSDSREYSCPWDGCTFAFKTNGSLKRHIRRHTGERPYVCEMCNRSFGESGALTRHMKSRTPCTQKADSDLPRYGKKVDLSIQNYNQHDRNLKGTVTMIASDMQAEQTYIQIEQEPQEFVVMSAADVPAQGESMEIESTSVERGEDQVDDNLGESYDISVNEVDQANEANQCRACVAIFNNTEELKKHLKTHLAHVPFRCSICSYVTETQESLRIHMHVEHQTLLKEGSDEIAEGEIMDATLQNTAAEPHNQEVQCTEEIVATDVSQPVGEVRLETEEQRKEAVLAMKQLMELHMAKVREVDAKIEGFKTVHRCPVCLRQFRGTSYLRLHMRSHTGERPHKCSLCEKAFTTRDTLNKHMQTHSNERQFKCGVCGKMFKRISHVREHIKTHNDERPFPCNFCDKSFKTANASKVHMRTHTDHFPWACKVCNRSFREKGSLERHVRTHTGEKPYKCPYCQRPFAEHGTLNRHLKAKVPCTRLLHQARISGTGPAIETIVENQIHQQQQQQQAMQQEVPTVLAEFSLVVADTQQYMKADGQTDHVEQSNAEVVMVNAEEDGETIQNIEVVTDGSIVDGEFIILEHTADKITVLNQRTGETLDMLPTSDVIVASDTNEESIQAVAMIPQNDNQIEAVALAPIPEHVDETIVQEMQT